MADMEQYRESFRMFDKDGDGEITCDEFKQIVKSIGFDGSDEEVERMIYTVSHKATIDFPAFCRIMINQSPYNDTEVDFLRCLRVLDIDGTGKANCFE